MSRSRAGGSSLSVFLIVLANLMLETTVPAVPAGNIAAENARSPALAAQATLLSCFWSTLLLEYASTSSWAAYSRLNEDILRACATLASSLGSFVVVAEV